MKCPKCNEEISNKQLAIELGRKGGHGCSQKKREALKKNAKKKRPKKSPLPGRGTFF